MISIDELERLEKASTPGPWSGDARGTHCDPAQDTVTVKTSLGNLFKLDKWDAAACANDADLIIETRNALPALIAEVRELRAARECYAACAKERDVMKMRLAELEAFAARMRETPRRVCEALHTMSKSAFVYDVEGEDDEDAEEMCSEDTINYIADEFRVGKHNAAIFGEGPLPWDEKGGGV